MAKKYKYVSPEEVLALARQMHRSPEIRAIFDRVKDDKDFVPEEARVVSGFIEARRLQLRAEKRRDYGRLSLVVPLLRHLANGKWSSLDDPKVFEYLREGLPMEEESE